MSYLLLQAAATLFYFQVEGGTCHWTVRSMPAGAPERVHSTPTCPVHLVWEPSARTAWYTLGHDLHSVSWKEHKAELRARLPFTSRLDHMAWVSRLRVSAGTGKVRVAFLEPVAEADVVTRGDRTFFRRKGELKPDEDAGFIGSPRFAVAWDLQPNGQWTEVAAVPTNAEAGDTLGLSVLKSALDSRRGTYALDELEDALRERDWDRAEFTDVSARQDEFARVLLGADEGVGYIDLGKRSGIVFRLTYGDDKHAASPVYCCKDSCATMEKLRGLPESPRKDRHLFGFQFSADTLLVRPESGPGAWVYRICEPDPVVFGDAQSAHWLPFDAAFTRRTAAH
jgi:hypothetical protein